MHETQEQIFERAAPEGKQNVRQEGETTSVAKCELIDCPQLGFAISK